jgi:hypothetical protein
MKRRCNTLTRPEAQPLCAHMVVCNGLIHYCVRSLGHEKNDGKDARLHRCYHLEWRGK